jgi:hypothetical protein
VNFAGFVDKDTVRVRVIGWHANVVTGIAEFRYYSNKDVTVAVDVDPRTAPTTATTTTTTTSTTTTTLATGQMLPGSSCCMVEFRTRRGLLLGGERAADLGQHLSRI